MPTKIRTRLIYAVAVGLLGLGLLATSASAEVVVERFEGPLPIDLVLPSEPESPATDRTASAKGFPAKGWVLPFVIDDTVSGLSTTLMAIRHAEDDLLPTPVGSLVFR